MADTLFVFEAIGGARKWFSPDGDLVRSSGRFDQTERARGTLLMIGSLGGRMRFEPGWLHSRKTLFRVDLRGEVFSSSAVSADLESAA